MRLLYVFGIETGLDSNARKKAHPTFRATEKNSPYTPVSGAIFTCFAGQSAKVAGKK